MLRKYSTARLYWATPSPASARDSSSANAEAETVLCSDGDETQGRAASKPGRINIRRKTNAEVRKCGCTVSSLPTNTGYDFRAPAEWTTPTRVERHSEPRIPQPTIKNGSGRLIEQSPCFLHARCCGFLGPHAFLAGTLVTEQPAKKFSETSKFLNEGPLNRQDSPAGRRPPAGQKEGVHRRSSSGVYSCFDSSIHRIVETLFSHYSLRVPQGAGGLQLCFGSVPP